MTTIIDRPLRRRRGRPLQMTPEGVLDQIRQLADREGGLFRIHRSHSGLYARARRQFGSWSEAVRRAGVDYSAAIDTARARSLRNRTRRGGAGAGRPADRMPGVHASLATAGDREEDFSRP